MKKIDELPVEMLMKVFSYLPNYDTVSLVNKLFYNVACKLTDAGDYVKFSSIFLVSKKQFLDSIIAVQLLAETLKKLEAEKPQSICLFASAVDVFV